jgi:hypothetical protein
MIWRCWLLIRGPLYREPEGRSSDECYDMFLWFDAKRMNGITLLEYLLCCPSELKVIASDTAGVNETMRTLMEKEGRRLPADKEGCPSRC